MISRTNNLFGLLVLSLVGSFSCLGFCSQALPKSKVSFSELSFNEDASPFGDIRVTDAVEEGEEVPSDLPKDVKQDTVDETLGKERTLYEILGAPNTATRSELKRFYVKLAKATHPDAQIGRDDVDQAKNLDDFNDIAAAWRILGDEKLRKRYDFDLKAKAFSEKAQRSADDFLEEAAPVVSKMVDNVAGATMAVGDAMGKGMAGLMGLSKLAMSVAKAVDEEKAEKAAMRAEQERLEKVRASLKAAEDAKVNEKLKEAKQAAKQAELAARKRAAERLAQRAIDAANAKAEEQAQIFAAKEKQAKEEPHFVEQFDGSNQFLKQLEQNDSKRRRYRIRGKRQASEESE